MSHAITIDEDQRQLVILSLAQLSLDRPGWVWTLGEVAKRFPGGLELYEQHRQMKSTELTAAAERSQRKQLSNVAETCAKIAETWRGVTGAKVIIEGVAEELRQYSADLAGTGENMRTGRMT